MRFTKCSRNAFSAKELKKCDGTVVSLGQILNRAKFLELEIILRLQNLNVSFKKIYLRQLCKLKYSRDERTSKLLNSVLEEVIFTWKTLLLRDIVP